MRTNNSSELEVEYKKTREIMTRPGAKFQTLLQDLLPDGGKQGMRELKWVNQDFSPPK